MCTQAVRVIIDETANTSIGTVEKLHNEFGPQLKISDSRCLVYLS